MNLNELKTELLKNKKIKEAFAEHDLALNISLKIIEARIRAGLTQAQLAKKIGTKQPSIARVENGDKPPSFPFLNKIEKALNTSIISISPTNHPFETISSSTETEKLFQIKLKNNFFDKFVTKSNFESKKTSTSPTNNNYSLNTC